MDQQVLYIYLTQIADSAEDGRLALVRLDTAISQRALGAIFSELDRFLVQASRVSRFLWPGAPGGRTSVERNQRKSHSDIRSRRLREVLGVGQNHQLRNRSLRDHLEHADERLDDWANSSARRNYADRNIGPASAIRGLDPTDMFRNYDPQTGVFSYRGEEFHIPTLAGAMFDILEKAIAARESNDPINVAHRELET